ncbi:ADP-ribosylglycohydrolase family protein [Halomonas denitrificans]|nr:ADP-ribosylglycohydrolase family protein [Halomonas denitrificans]
MNPQDHSLYDHHCSTALGSLLGLAMGDALGTTLEFTPKTAVTPITDIVGGGPFGLEPGQWTDDTSMMLCLADSLIETGANDLNDQIARYQRWLSKGENSCTGHCFDIGNTVRAALGRYQQNGDPIAGSTDEYSAGNGSLMRIAPIAAFYCRQDVEVAMAAAAESSRTTHGEQRAVEACELMTLLLHRLYTDKARDCKNDFLSAALSTFQSLRSDCHRQIAALLNGGVISKPRDAIRGTGFVVDSLEAALWCFAQAENFAQGALLAANLGDDADTTAAIYGMLAGAYWGEGGLPRQWLTQLAWAERLDDRARWLVSRPNNQTLRNLLVRLDAAQRQNRLSSSLLHRSAYEAGIVIPQINYERVFDRKPWQSINVEQWFADATFEQCLLWLFAQVRAERFCEGTLSTVLKNGSVAKWTSRLHEIIGR